MLVKEVAKFNPTTTSTYAIEEPDEAKAKEMWKGVEEYIKENTMLTNICPEMHAVIAAKDLKGFSTIERGYLDVTNFYR